MASLLLAIIYLAFISLGLPDGLLGAAWPAMRLDIAAPLSAAGIVSMIITLGTITSSLLSDRLTKRLGAGLVTAVSVAATAAALFGFSLSSAFWQLCLWAIPYGLGAGAIDAALNNYVALHYQARHMSWLHCFWGVGASVGPYIMGLCLSGGGQWTSGYRVVSIIQIALTLGLFLSLPLWKSRVDGDAPDDKSLSIGIRQALRIPGVKAVLIAFFAYCAAESTMMVWAASYLSDFRHITAEKAASLASLFYLGMMVGRFLSGFVADRLQDRNLIRIGIATAMSGVLLLLFSPTLCAVVGVFVIGFGCAPVYPSIIHATPYHFGSEHSGAIIGIEMAAAYAGSCLIPPLFGVLAQCLGAGILPLYITVLFAVQLVMSERLNATTKRRPL